MVETKSRVVISVSEIEKNNAGPKAKVDIDKVLKEKENFQVIDLHYNWDSKLLKFRYISWDIPHLMRHLDADEIFFQFPSYSRTLMNSFVKNIRKYTKAKLFFIIHDLESLRSFSADPTYKPEEIKWLKEADGLIAHNQKMIAWIRENGVKTPIVKLGLFDYLNPQAINTNTDYNKSICFAGNLKKAGFLAQLPASVRLDVFGPNLDPQLKEKVTYKGLYTPEELPKHLTENFGLIWDGNSADKCDGVYGNYLRYNCPHKASLYLSTGLPIIVWRKAAIANYIERNKLGFAVDSLDDIPVLLDSVTPDQFKELKANAQKVAKELRAGQHIRNAVNKIETVTK